MLALIILMLQLMRDQVKPRDLLACMGNLNGQTNIRHGIEFGVFINTTISLG
jgi:hypothetical protein